MSQFFKRTIKCRSCGKPTQTIFVCADCFAKIPHSDRAQFRRNYIKGFNTARHETTMLERLKTLKTAGSVPAVVLFSALLLFSALAITFGSMQKKSKPAPVIDLGVQWLGSPVIAQERVTGHLTNVEFGIRGDGVVIWRDKRGPAVDGKRFGQFEMPPPAFAPAGKILP